MYTEMYGFFGEKNKNWEDSRSMVRIHLKTKPRMSSQTAGREQQSTTSAFPTTLMSAGNSHGSGFSGTLGPIGREDSTFQLSGEDSVGSIGVELRAVFLYLISLCLFNVSLGRFTYT